MDKVTRNTLDCDQSNYCSRIVFSHIPIEFGQISPFQFLKMAALAKPQIVPFDPPTPKTLS